MPQKNIILNSLKQSFAFIWKSKSLFILLFILQIIFFGIFFVVSQTYLSRILEHAKAISDYISKQQLDDVSVASNILQQKNIFGGDPLIISRNFNEIVKNFRIYLICIFILLIIFISIAWTMTIWLIHKNKLKQLIKYFLKNFIVLLFYLGLIFSFFYSLFNISLTEVAAEGIRLLTKYVPFFIFSIILSYFMFVSLSLHNTELKSIMRKTLSIGIKKIHYILAIYFINTFLLAISMFLLYYFIEKNLFIASLSMALMLFSFVFGRIFMVNVVGKLEKS